MKKTKGSDSYSHVIKYTGLFGGIQGLNILVSIVRNKLVALLLGPDGMGLISLFNSTVKLVSDSTNLGISMSAVKNISEAYDSDDSSRLNHTICIVSFWSLIVAVLGMLLMLTLSPLLSKLTFSYGGLTIHYICLSPVVAFIAITGGESAILKGTRHLSGLAFASVLNVMGAFLVSVPLYYLFGMSAIVPTLLLLALVQMVITLSYSLRFYPLSFSYDRILLKEGAGMVRLGVAFVMAGILGSGAEFVIRTFLNIVGSTSDVGLYNAGYMMTMTYAGLVFSAMESDYFPRLSAVGDSVLKLNETVNRQVEVTLLLISPMLVAFMISLPILLPLLYSGMFMPALGMIQVMTLALYARALTLPIEYVTLAKGDSRSYLFLEAIYDIMLVIMAYLGFSQWKLFGMGVAVTVTSILNVILVYAYSYFKYGYRMSSNVLMYMMIHIPVGCLAYAVTIFNSPLIYWGVGTMLFIVSLSSSLSILRSKTSLWNKLKERYASKFLRK